MLIIDQIRHVLYVLMGVGAGLVGLVFIISLLSSFFQAGKNR